MKWQKMEWKTLTVSLKIAALIQGRLSLPTITENYPLLHPINN